ncbi:hypothetical protein TorRG33x02_198820 [Trema orientale]|uniref:Uncharacterized protein n=1 Tax=Trema orientale TaxID=63057 RepID=A0A2P5EFI9_TREOI|nr:hypothetical protein TorRG33x02_198820 [Trema orientale]
MWSLSPVRLDSSTCKEYPCRINPSAGTWSPILSNTISPTTTSHIEICFGLPPLMTSIWISFMISDPLWNCISSPKSLRAVQVTTKSTAIKIPQPSYQPFRTPCSLISNPSARPAKASKMRRQEPFKASTTK